MAPTVSNLIRVARSQLGYHEYGGPDGDDGNGTKYGAWFGLNYVAWCAIFSAWTLGQLGINIRQLVSAYYAGVVNAVAGWKSKGWFHPGTAGIRPGDIPYFDFPGEASVDHVAACVEKVDRNGVHTIEGNTSPGTAVSDPNGGGVYRRLRAPNLIVGYGRLPQNILRFNVAARIKHAAVRRLGKKYPTLRRGDHGPAVIRLKRLLTKRGYHGFAVHTPAYGAGVEHAVVAFQRSQHLTADGEAGPKTLADLRF